MTKEQLVPGKLIPTALEHQAALRQTCLDMLRVVFEHGTSDEKLEAERLMVEALGADSDGKAWESFGVSTTGPLPVPTLPAPAKRGPAWRRLIESKEVLA